MKSLKKLAFLIEEFELETPAQQLLDRFLLGYPREGEFHRPEGCSICAHLLNAETASAELDRRVNEHGLGRETELDRAVSQADGLVFVPHGSGANPTDAVVESVLRKAAPGARCFVHGALGSNLAAARQQADLARSRGLRLLVGTSVSVTWRLPQVDLPLDTPVTEALIVVQGASPGSELAALDGLLPLVERRKGGESGVRAVRSLKGPDVWNAGKERAWSWDLLAAALSRSDSPQGDPVTDGRTQDLIGLGLVPKLAKDPRAWIVEHRDGLRSTFLILDGVVADYNVAVQSGDGGILSAQLYRPPKPAQHEFSRLAAVIEDFFQRRQSALARLEEHPDQRIA